MSATVISIRTRRPLVEPAALPDAPAAMIFPAAIVVWATMLSLVLIAGMWGRP